MKILHTGDWHLGHTLYDYDRYDEQQSMLASITEIAKIEKPDLLLICGDVFDTSQPSAQAQRLWAETVMTFRTQVPEMAVVAIAGNHDSAARHEIFRTPWEYLGVTVVGRIGRDSDISDFIVEIPDVCYVAAVPYVSGRNMPVDLFPRLLEEIDKRNLAGLPVVIAAHAAVVGCISDGHDVIDGNDGRPDIIGGVESMSLADFGRGYDYLALGHIHGAQKIAGSQGRARYAGSPMPMNFEERGKRSITLAEIAHGSEPRIRLLEITPARPLVDIPEKHPVSWPEAIRELEQFDTDADVYLRLNVLHDSALPAAATAEAARICEGKKARFCQLRLHPVATGHKPESRKGLRVEEFRNMSPLEIAIRYSLDGEMPFGDELQRLFNEAVEESKREDNET